MIMGAFVLLAPDTDDPIPVEVMRMVSAQLIEEPELIERLRTGQRDAAVQLLEEKAGSSVLRTRKLSIKGGNAENILHCRSFARRTEFTERMRSCESSTKRKRLFVEITD